MGWSGAICGEGYGQARFQHDPGSLLLWPLSNALLSERLVMAVKASFYFCVQVIKMYSNYFT